MESQGRSYFAIGLVIFLVIFPFILSAPHITHYLAGDYPPEAYRSLGIEIIIYIFYYAVLIATLKDVVRIKKRIEVKEKVVERLFQERFK